MTHKEVVISPPEGNSSESTVTPETGSPSIVMGASERLWRLWFALGGLLAILSLLGFAGEVWWPLEVLANFRIQYSIGLAAIAPTAVLKRRWKGAFFFSLLAVINIAQLVPYYQGSPGPAPAAGFKPWRAITLNVHTSNESFEAVRALVRERRPDLLVLTEVNDRWMAELASLEADYPFWKAVPQSDNFGIAFFSRIQSRSMAIRGFGASGIPSIVAEFGWGSGTLTVVGTHPLPPRKFQYVTLWEQQMARLGEFLAGTAGPRLVLGDLNATPWSAPFKSLLQRTGLRDSGIGHGVHPTWPTNVPLFWIPIDHALVSPDLAVVSRRVGGDVGSDHLPVEIEFAPGANEMSPETPIPTVKKLQRSGCYP